MTDGRLIRQSNEDALALSQQTTAFLKKHKLEEPLLPIPIPLLSPSDSIDHWMMCEKLFLAALRVGDDKAAFECLQRLIQRFGASDERVMGLRGLYQESVAVDEKALNKVLKEYQDILTEDPVNIAVRKRRVALLKSLSRMAEAIEALADLLDISPADPEAWIELAELYVEQGLFSQGQYCFEEALIIVPTAWNLHARVGEVWYMSAMNDSESNMLKGLAESLRRFCRSVELCDGYLRGFYGLKMVTDHLLELADQNPSLARSNELEGLPPQKTIQQLNEKATSHLLIIIQSAKHSGLSRPELTAAKQLIEKSSQNVEH